jgi:hypothetical protein
MPQSQIVTLHQPHQLAKLVRLRQSTNRLEVDQLRDLGVREHVVAAAHTAQLEAEALHEATYVAERHVGQLATRETDKELALIHGRNVDLAWDGGASPNFVSCSGSVFSCVQYLDGYRVEVLEMPSA